MNVIHKVTAAKAAGSELTFVLSDESKDRVGDVIKADGWNLRNFQRNPIALFNHNSSFPIGFWKNVRTEGKALLGDLTLAAEGTSDRIDEIRRLVDQGILRAVSVGFVPIKTEPLDKGNGIRFLQQELVETSLVSVPANPAAVQLAKSLNVSDDTIKLVFGEQAEADRIVVRGSSGEHAATNRISGKQTKMELSVSQQVAGAQNALVDLQDQLRAKVDGGVLDESIDELTDRIDVAKREVTRLQRVEQSLASASQPIVVRDTDSGRTLSHSVDRGSLIDVRRPWAAPEKKLTASDYMFRSVAIMVELKRDNVNPADLVQKYFGNDRVTRGLTDLLVTRAASAPAMTTVAGWAQELATTAYLEMIDTLMPLSVYPKLAARGPRFSFGQAGTVSIPARTTSTTVAGSFVAQGAPIPVRQGAFSAKTLTPKKMAVITSLTREMMIHSNSASRAGAAAGDCRRHLGCDRYRAARRHCGRHDTAGRHP